MIRIVRNEANAGLAPFKAWGTSLSRIRPIQDENGQNVPSASLAEW